MQAMSLWPPYGTRQAIIVSSCGFFLLSFSRRLILAVIDWMSTILWHMVWPYCEFRMQVWNVLRSARWKCRTQKIAKKSSSGHHRTRRAMSLQLRHVLTIGKKLVKQQYLLQMSSQYGKLQPISGWDLLASLGHPSKFQRVSRLGGVTAWQSSSGRQPNVASLNRGRHLYLTGRPQRWASAHILVLNSFLPLKNCTYLSCYLQLQTCCFICQKICRTGHSCLLSHSWLLLTNARSQEITPGKSAESL